MITEEQNGFRKKRSCDEHVFVLQPVIHNRILQKKSAFVRFIDIKRAFDVVDRDPLWWKLKHAGTGTDGKFLRILQGLYHDTKCAVRVGDRLTDWFPSNIGLKQECLLSPILFSILIDDLAKEIKYLNIGVEIGDTLLSILLYADDIAILASTPEELQLMLDTIYVWLKNWRLTLNRKKSKVVHFCPKNVKQIEHNFHCVPTDIDLAKTYTYLGFLFHKHNDLTVGAHALTQSACKALSAVLCKTTTIGGLGFATYFELFHTGIASILDYGGGVWGFKKPTCIDTVQHRAIRAFSGI